MFWCSWNLVDFETVISGAFPSLNAPGVRGHTIIPIPVVSSAHAREKTSYEIDEIRTHDTSFVI